MTVKMYVQRAYEYTNFAFGSKTTYVCELAEKNYSFYLEQF